MKKRLVAASTDPNGLSPFGPQVTSDLTSQLSNCSLPQKSAWASDLRQPFPALIVAQLGANMPTSSKSEHIPSGDENRNSPGFASPIANSQNQFSSSKKADIASQASFNTNQLIEAFLHSSQLAAHGASSQQKDIAQIFLEMMKTQLSPQQQQQQPVPPPQTQVVSRSIPSRTTPDKLLITSRSPPLRPPSETLRGFVDGNHSKSRNSYAHSPALQSSPPSLAPSMPPIQSLSTSASARSQPGRPLTASDYNSAASAFYNQLLCMMAQQQQQQQQQIRGQHHPSQSQMPFPTHSEDDKKPPQAGYSKVGMSSNPRNPAKYDPYVSQIRPPSQDSYARTALSYYSPWSSSSAKLESSSPATLGSSYSTIDILRESKQASESVKPTNKMLTTSGVFYPEKQPVAPPPVPSAPPAAIKNQSDAVDHHFRMSLSNNRSAVGVPSNPGINLEAGPPNLVDLNIEKKANTKNPHNPNHSNLASAVGLGVSSCSSSSSISSMSVFDRDAGSPGRKPPFLLPPPKTENRINSEACRYSLKKRLIQRYQADATTEQATESLKQEEPSKSPLQIPIKQEVPVKLEASSPPNHSTFGDPVKVEDEPTLPHGHELPDAMVSSHSDVNGSILDGTSKEASKRNMNSTARRHPPIRASKIAPLMCTLNVSSLSPTSMLSPGKRSRCSGAKQHLGFSSMRKRGAPASGSEFTGARASRAKTAKPRFYNSRVASPAATSDTAVHSGRRNRTTSVRSATDTQAHSEFDFNGQDDDEAPTIPMVTSKSTNRRWFGSRKRKSTAPAAGPLLRVKIPRRSMEDEVSRTKWSKHPRRNQNSNRQSNNINKNSKTAAFTDEDDDLVGCSGREFNDDDIEMTIRAEQDDDQEPDEAADDEGESLTCRRCGQLVKALKLGCNADPFDYQCCCEDKISVQEIEKLLPPPPNLAILSHRSLCGGELGSQDIDDAISESEVPFLQLNSCTELEKLKSSSRCRACREASRVSSTTTVETNSTNSGVNHNSNNNLADKSGSRRRGSNNRNHLASNSTSLGHNGDSKTGAATVSVFCRFWGFRKLYYDQKGLLNVSDFCRTSEADSVDRSLWAMHRHVSPSLSRHNAIYCLDRLGAIACRLMLSELSILTSSVSTANTVIRQCCPPSSADKSSSSTPSRHLAWKRPVQGVREMCDVCETTMFNSHWVCTKCGYSVCSACYYAKANALPPNKSTKDSPDPLGDATSSVDASTTHGSVADEDGVKSLSPAVIELSYEDYSVRQPWSTCSASRRPHDPAKMMLTALLPYGSLHCLWHRLHRIFPRLDCPCGQSANQSSESAHKHQHHQHHHHQSMSSMGGTQSPASSTDTSAATSLDLLADLALKSSTSSGGSPEDDVNVDTEMMDGSERRELSQKAGATGVLYLKDGDSANLKAFQRHWATNQPVAISGCGRHFNSSLWTAKSLSREKGSGEGTSQIVLIDCETNLIVPRHPVRSFWEAFESHPNSTKRSSSSKESSKPTQHLKIREWPPMGDLSETFPDRYVDFTEHLPLPEYTHREGQLNLAARLPSFFVKPDLGPRLHIAHDLTSQPKIGTMNLRLDATDVINVLMHATRSVSQVPPKGSETQLRAFLRSAGVNLADVFHAKGHTNVVSNRGLPGAVWHIFRPCDTAGLREYLIKIDKLTTNPSSGSASTAGGDVIHDQRMFLSQGQLEELKVETGIKPYTVLQFPGDAILIPAGSVHQVRNLGNCINVSSDFISPEHVPQCLELTEEFRRLPRNHPSHEDKLQVKNMIYHTVKDALSTLLKASTTNQSQQQNPDSPSPM